MASIDYIYQIAEICSTLGIEDAIICPGSRSAPLTISFARNAKIKSRLVFDERSAAYIALGMAQKSRKPVVLICTSGTAALNFAPAVAEAYWQQIPLLILTGDRPPEWIGQGDGQTINQKGIYDANCKASFTLPVDKHHKDSIWILEKIVSEAIFKTTEQTFGPVHINIPAREPFYPAKDTEIRFETSPKIFKGIPIRHHLARDQWNEIIGLFTENSKVLIISGHQLPDNELSVIVNSFLEYNSLPLIADVNSNLMGVKNAVVHYDLQISSFSEEQKLEFQPEILISFGNEFISKNLKQYLRKYKPKVHLHISENEHWVDTFQSATHFVKVSPSYFFNELMNKTKIASNKDYVTNWLAINNKIENQLHEFNKKIDFTEIASTYQVLNSIPQKSILHLSNSLPVRYVNLLGIRDVEVYCNRGTSGIDGCVSTAVGSALKTTEPVTLISGDIAFLYDRNAFWHNDLPDNLRFVVINNGGGQIFRTIEGAKDQPELESFFVGNHQQDMQSIAMEYRLDYTKVSTLDSLKQALNSFYKPGDKSKILEIMIDGKEALNSLKAFKDFIFKSL